MDRYRVQVIVQVELTAENFHGAAEISEKVLKGDMGKPDHLRIINADTKSVTAL